MEEKQGAEARKDAAATPEVQAGASREAGEPAGRRRGRRWPIVVGVVAVVLVAAGAGFWVWHEQPGFCNAICHDPMDAYVEGYYEDATLMANAHARADVTCLQCHEAKIEEQVTEGLAWVRGDFATDESGHLTVQGVTADKKMCATAGCHDWEDVKAAHRELGRRGGREPARVPPGRGHRLQQLPRRARRIVYVLQHLPRLRRARRLGKPPVGSARRRMR